MKTKKTGYTIIGLIITSILLLIFSFISPIVFTASTGNPRFNFNITGQIGDTIGGLMNPFIALAGVFITFLAFYMQYKANQIQIDLFNKNQSEQNTLLKEQMFFRFLDNINQKIFNFIYNEKTDDGNLEFVSYKALDNLIKRFFYKIDGKCILLGRQLLASIPEMIADDYFNKITDANRYVTDLIKDPSELRNAIISLETNVVKLRLPYNLLYAI